MISHIETIYRRGEREVNEDAFVTFEEAGIFAAIDGASGLGGLSGAIAAGIIRDALLSEEGDLHARILKGNIMLGLKAVEALDTADIKVLADIPKFRRSSCGLAAVQLANSGVQLNYVAAGDCLLFLQYKNNEIRQVNIDQVEPLDRVAIEMTQVEWRRYLTNKSEDPNGWDLARIKETQKRIRELIGGTLQKNRNKLNSVEGYGIIDGSREAVDFLECGTIPLINVKKILLLSDGLKMNSHRRQPVENEWLCTAKLAFEQGLDHLEKAIVDIEAGDPSCYQYPRLKQYDDKTGILIHLR